MLGFLSEADYKLVAKAIRHRVTAIKHHREKQQRLKEGGPDHTPETTQPAGPAPAPPTCAPAEVVTYRVSEGAPTGGLSCSCTSQSHLVLAPHRPRPRRRARRQ